MLVCGHSLDNRRSHFLENTVSTEGTLDSSPAQLQFLCNHFRPTLYTLIRYSFACLFRHSSSSLDEGYVLCNLSLLTAANGGEILNLNGVLDCAEPQTCGRFRLPMLMSATTHLNQSSVSGNPILRK